MLKKYIGVLCFSVLAAIASPAESSSPFDGVIPGEALIYYGSDSTSGESIELTNFEKAMSIWVETLDDFMEWRILKDEWNALCDEVGVDDGLSSLVGEQWCVAFYPLFEGIPLPGAALFVTQPDDPAQADRALTELFKAVAQKIPVLTKDKDDYHGHLIQSLYGPGMLPGLGLYYSIEESKIFISNRKPLLMKAMDRLDDGEDFLKDNETYREAISHLPSDRSSTLLVDTGEIFRMVQMLTQNLHAIELLKQINPKISTEEIEQYLPIVDRVISYLSIVQCFASGATIQDGNKEITTGYVSLDLENVDETIRAMFTRPPMPFKFENYLPRDTGSVSANNFPSLKDIWVIANTIMKEFPFYADFQSGLEKVEDEFDFSLEEDLFSWIGDESCVASMVLDLEAVLPVNRFVFFIQITNEAKCRNAFTKLEKALQEFGLPIAPAKEDYRGTAITAYGLPLPMIPITPTWCIHDGNLIVTSDTDLLREMLDVKAGTRRGIGRNRFYKLLKDGLSQKATMFSFQDTESEFYNLREGLKRIGSISELGPLLSGENQMLPFMVIDRISYLLGCIQIMKANTQHAVITEDSITSTRVWLYQDLRYVPPADTIRRYKVSLLGLKGLVAALGDWCVQNGDKKRAIRLYETLSDFYPDEGPYLSILGDLYKSEGRNVEAALKAFDRAMERMPETAYVIGREALQESSADEIIERVRAAAEYTARVEEDVALFGIALAKRDAGEYEAAEALFSEVVKKFSKSSAFVSPAQQELAVLNEGIPTGAIEITPAPSIQTDSDVLLSNEIWRRCPSFPLQGEALDGINQADLRMAGNESHVFVQLQGSDSVETRDTERFFKIVVCPNRDYSRITEYRVKVQFNDGRYEAKAFKEAFIVDPHGLTLEGKNKRSNANKPDLRQILKSMGAEDILPLLDLAGPGGKGKPGTSQEKKSDFIVRMNSTEKDGTDHWSLEIAIPVEPSKKQEHFPWLINAVRILKNEDREAVQSLSAEDDPESPLSCKWLQR